MAEVSYLAEQHHKICLAIRLLEHPLLHAADRALVVRQEWASLRYSWWAGPVPPGISSWSTTPMTLTPAASTEEDLLVLYPGGEVKQDVIGGAGRLCLERRAR